MVSIELAQEYARYTGYSIPTLNKETEMGRIEHHELILPSAQ